MHTSKAFRTIFGGKKAYTVLYIIKGTILMCPWTGARPFGQPRSVIKHTCATQKIREASARSCAAPLGCCEP